MTTTTSRASSGSTFSQPASFTATPTLYQFYSSWEDWSFEAFANSVRLNGVDVGDQSGLFGNLTAVGLERLYPTEAVKSFNTMNPASDGAFPDKDGNTKLNFDEAGSLPNASVVTYGSKDGYDNMVSA